MDHVLCEALVVSGDTAYERPALVKVGTFAESTRGGFFAEDEPYDPPIPHKGT